MGLQLCLFVLGAMMYSLPLSYCLTLSSEHPSPNVNPTSFVFASVKRLSPPLSLYPHPLLLLMQQSCEHFIHRVVLWFVLISMTWYNSNHTNLLLKFFHFIPVRPSYCQFLSLYYSCLWSTYRQIPQKVKKRQPFLHSLGNDSPNLLWHSGVNCILLSIESRC